MARTFFHKLALLLAICYGLALPAAASAHGGIPNGPQQVFVQQIGPYQITVAIEVPQAVPAPLFVDVVPSAAMGSGSITLRAAPRGVALDSRDPATVQVLPGRSGAPYVTLQADRAGPWELEVVAVGPEGRGTARIPFTIVPLPALPYSLALFGALGILFATMLGGVGLAALSQSGRAAPRWLERGLGYALCAAATAAAMLGWLQYSASAAPAVEPLMAPSMGGTYSTMAVATEPSSPAADVPFSLKLRLRDGSTGLPTDDLVTHHQALLHLLIIDDAGQTFRHLHPARVAPGELQIALGGLPGGRYTVYTEIARAGGGAELLRAPLTIAGDPPPAAPVPQGLGVRSIAGLSIAVSADGLRAGQPSTIALTISRDGRPVSDIQPWLGMAGHLIARSEDGQVVAHIHAAGSMAGMDMPGMTMDMPGMPGMPQMPTAATQGIAPTPTSYGLEIGFVYTFPQPGVYRLWAQFQERGQIITVPIALDVMP